MLQTKLLSAAVLTSVAVAGFSASASAATVPSPEGPGCRGKIVAYINHISGPSGASGNPSSSAGPGYFLKGETSAAVHAAKEFCS
jgi:hypothetical protein